MSIQNSYPNSPERPSVEPVQPSPSIAPPRRIRTACNSCHQAKIRCSGGTPCLGCQTSGTRCIYSTGNRLGRPKGSRNKRSRVQGNQNQAAGSSQNNVSSSNGPDVLQWTNSTEAQSETMSMDVDFDHAFDNAFNKSICGDMNTGGNPDSLSSPNLNLLFESLDASRMPTSTENDLSSFFTEVSDIE